jgi:hypothetical protein
MDNVLERAGILSAGQAPALPGEKRREEIRQSRRFRNPAARVDDGKGRETWFRLDSGHSSSRPKAVADGSRQAGWPRDSCAVR